MLLVSCTNRKNSNTLKVAKYYQEMIEQKGQEAPILSLVNLPDDLIGTAMYENQGQNQVFEEKFQKVVEQHDKFFFVMPEYNGSFPGVLKTFTDCLKFPASLRGKKAALVGLSSGTQGAALALSHYGDILNYLGVNILGQRVRMPGIEKILQTGIENHQTYNQLIDLQIDLMLDF